MSRKTDYLRGVVLEMKADADTGMIEGYGSVFGVPDLGGDIVMRGAFSASLASGRVPKMLWQHNAMEPIGVWENVSEDENGLKMSGRILTETTKGRDAIAFARAGAVDGLSIGFRVTDADMDQKTGSRMIKGAELWEVSMVTFPMNEAARIHSVKSAAEIDAMTETEIEKCLREASDFSRAETKRIVHRLLAIGSQRKAAEFEGVQVAESLANMLRRIKP